MGIILYNMLTDPRCKKKFQDIRLLENPSEADIQEAVKALKIIFQKNEKKKPVPTSQVLYIFYTGHGVVLSGGSGDSFMLLTDLEKTTVSFDEIVRDLSIRKNTETLAIFDACRSIVPAKGDEVE